MRRAAMIGVTGAAVLLSVSNVEGQRPRRLAQPSGHFDMSFIAANPVGELGLFFDQGFGAQFGGAVPIAAEGRVRLRGDFGFLVYGWERQDHCFSLPIGCRIDLDLNTTNNILFGGLGPEIALATGAVEPYVHGTVGFSYFFTTSSLSGDGYYRDDFGTTTNYSDAVLAWRAGGGIRVRLTDGRKPVSLDLGLERHENGVADFLTKGDIQDHPDGSITVFPNRSEANLVTFRLGISIGVPRSGRR